MRGKEEKVEVAGGRRDRFRERSGGEETEIMLRGKESEREKREVKECHERESKKLKNVKQEGEKGKERTSSHMIIAAAVSIEIDLTLR